MKVHVTENNIQRKSFGDKTNDLFDKYDAFGAPVPSFTIRGKTHQGSSIGFILTIFVSALVIAFSTNKFVHLVNKENPFIASTKFT